MRSCTLAFLLLFVLAGFAAAAEEPSGVYKGEYSGASGVSGGIRLDFQKGTDGAWKCEASFTVQGQDVPAKMKSIKIEGGRIELRYEFEIQGSKLESALSGDLKGRTIEGKYQTFADGNPIDDGNWKASSES